MLFRNNIIIQIIIFTSIVIVPQVNVYADMPSPYEVGLCNESEIQVSCIQPISQNISDTKESLCEEYANNSAYRYLTTLSINDENPGEVTVIYCKIGSKADTKYPNAYPQSRDIYINSQELLIGLLLTLIIEFGILYLFPLLRTKRGLISTIISNLISYPIYYIVFYNIYIFDILPYPLSHQLPNTKPFATYRFMDMFMVFIILTSIVILFEFIVFKLITKQNWKLIVKYILIANLFSAILVLLSQFSQTYLEFFD